MLYNDKVESMLYSFDCNILPTLVITALSTVIQLAIVDPRWSMELCITTLIDP